MLLIVSIMQLYSLAQKIWKRQSATAAVCEKRETCMCLRTIQLLQVQPYNGSSMIPAYSSSPGFGNLDQANPCQEQSWWKKNRDYQCSNIFFIKRQNSYTSRKWQQWLQSPDQRCSVMTPASEIAAPSAINTTTSPASSPWQALPVPPHHRHYTLLGIYKAWNYTPFLVFREKLCQAAGKYSKYRLWFWIIGL